MLLRVVSPEDDARYRADPHYTVLDCPFCDRGFGNTYPAKAEMARRFHVRAKHAAEVATIG